MNAKQRAFALMRKCEKYGDGDGWICRRKPEEVTDKYLLEELHAQADGAWYFFQVAAWNYGNRDECGIYVGPKNTVLVVAVPYNKDKDFEKQVRDLVQR